MLPHADLPPSLHGLSTYPLDKLLSMWKSGSITIEQVAGHLLQHLILLEKQVHLLQKSLPAGATHVIPIQKEHIVD